MSKFQDPPPPPSYESLGLPGQPQPVLPYGVQPAMSMQQTPAEAQWMIRPEGRLGCPPGLEYLSQLNQLILLQEIETSAGGMYGPVANSNWYRILNVSGQQVYTAREESSSLAGFCVCCPGQRGYVISIKDNLGHEVIRVTRDPLCCSCCPCLGCEHSIKIEAPAGRVVGYFKSQKGMGGIAFTISNSEDEVVFTMSFPCCATQSHFHQQEFHINSRDGSTEVAKITKQWGRMEFFFRLKKFLLSFPMDLDEGMKAVLLGTLFAIDVMYFPPIETMRRGRRM